MPTYTDTERFLQAVFPDWGTHGIFAHSTATGMAHFRKLSRLDGTRDCYWSVAAFPGLDGSAKRTTDRALEVRALAIDDVGTNVADGAVQFALGVPTAAVETSAGNFQWTYRLSKPVAIADWAGFFSAIEKLVGTSLHGRDAVHLFRLPLGVNTKPGRGGFAVRLAELNPGVELEVTQINIAGSGRVTRPGPSGGTGSDIKLGLDDLRIFMGWIPAKLFPSRAAWVEAGHDIKAICESDEDGFTVFDEWSEPEKSAGYNRATWDELGASGLRSTGGMLKGLAQELNPDGFAKMFAPLVFDDNPPPPPNPSGGGGGGDVVFHTGDKDQILSTMENAARALNGLGLLCRYDQFHHRVYVHRASGAVERLTDHLVLLLRVEINNRWGKDFGPVHIGDAVMALALRHGFNPVTDMLRGAEALWDGVARLDRLGPDYFHTDDTELARACFRKAMIAAVRRARRPGCKFDQILVTESPEGWDKSSAWAVLAGAENFSDADILGKDARAVQEELADIWIHEIADLSGLSRADIEHVKAFASRTNDRARPAYGKYLLDQARQSIEVGTTNSDSYLLSTTGNRRFWPFRLGSPVDLVRLRADRLMLWGEAAAAESLGETLVLDKRLWGVAGVEQEKRRAVDPWEDELGNLVEIPTGAVAPVGCERIEVRNGEHFISSLSVSEYLSGYRRQAMNSGSGRKIAEIMKRLGWERCFARVNGMMTRGYKRPIFNPSSVSVSSTVSKNPF